jgi:hypothetical protein
VPLLAETPPFRARGQPRRRCAGRLGGRRTVSDVCCGLSLGRQQVKPDLGTEPFEVGGLNVQLTVSTSSEASNVPFPFESWNS